MRAAIAPLIVQKVRRTSVTKNTFTATYRFAVMPMLQRTLERTIYFDNIDAAPLTSRDKYTGIITINDQSQIIISVRDDMARKNIVLNEADSRITVYRMRGAPIHFIDYIDACLESVRTGRISDLLEEHSVATRYARAMCRTHIILFRKIDMEQIIPCILTR